MGKFTIVMDEGLVKGLGFIVATMDRGFVKMRDDSGRILKDAKGKTVYSATERYTGLKDVDVATTFYKLMEKRGHLLAKVDNRDPGKDKPRRADCNLKAGEPYCDYETPCGRCKRDALVAHSDAAEKAGLIIRQPIKGRNKMGPDGKPYWQRGFVLYFRPGESLNSGNGIDHNAIADKVLAML